MFDTAMEGVLEIENWYGNLGLGIWLYCSFLVHVIMVMSYDVWKTIIKIVYPTH